MRDHKLLTWLKTLLLSAGICCGCNDQHDPEQGEGGTMKQDFDYSTQTAVTENGLKVSVVSCKMGHSGIEILYELQFANGGAWTFGPAALLWITYYDNAMIKLVEKESTQILLDHDFLVDRMPRQYQLALSPPGRAAYFTVTLGRLALETRPGPIPRQ